MPKATDGIAAEIEPRSAAHLELQPEVARSHRHAGQAETRFDAAQRAKLAARDDLALAFKASQVAKVKTLEQDAAVLPRATHQVCRLDGVRGQRLFAQHVLARRQCPSHPGGVQRGWQRDVDRVDIRGLAQRVVRAERPGNAVSGGKRLGFFERSRADRNNLDAGSLPGGQQQAVGDDPRGS